VKEAKDEAKEALIWKKMSDELRYIGGDRPRGRIGGGER